MKRWVPITVLVVGLCLFGFYRWTESPSSRSNEAAQGSNASTAGSLGIDGASETQSDAQSGESKYESGPEQYASALSRPTTNTRFRELATGPRPLTAENEERLDTFAKELAETDARFRDLRELAVTEAPDPKWSPDVEAQFQKQIAALGAHQTAIQTRPPHCSKSVCILVATGTLSTDASNANWQVLMSDIMSNPWFGENFNDSRTAMRADQKGIMYITFFMRKP